MHLLSPILAFTLGPMEGLIILGLILLLFGAKKLPGLARSIGRSTNEFKKGRAESAVEDDEEDDDSADGEAPDSK